MKETLKEYGIITIGCILFAVGFCWCCAPGHLSIGGFTGAAQVLNAFFPKLSVGITTLVMNVPLFILGWKFLGKRSLFSSIYAMAVSSLMIDGLNAIYAFPALEPILAAIYGGVLCGAACGLMLRQGATTGGTGLAARLLKLRIQQLPIGKLCLALDLTVITAYALTFRQLTQALYSIVMLYICTSVMDRVVYGGSASRLAFIISTSYREIAARLLKLDLGVTMLNGAGAYRRSPTEIIMCACSRHSIIPLKKMVQYIDPHAFVIVCDTREVLGEGFGAYDPTGL